MLAWGDPKYYNKVSYVFEYNYRIRGHPGSRMSLFHNYDEHILFNHTDETLDGWEEEWPTGGDPKDPSMFPVKFPYPRPHWATLRGRDCADLALPLPKSRQPTPEPPPVSRSIFTKEGASGF